MMIHRLATFTKPTSYKSIRFGNEQDTAIEPTLWKQVQHQLALLRGTYQLFNAEGQVLGTVSKTPDDRPFQRVIKIYQDGFPKPVPVTLDLKSGNITAIYENTSPIGEPLQRAKAAVEKFLVTFLQTDQNQRVNPQSLRRIHWLLSLKKADGSYKYRSLEWERFANTSATMKLSPSNDQVIIFDVKPHAQNQAFFPIEVNVTTGQAQKIAKQDIATTDLTTRLNAKILVDGIMDGFLDANSQEFYTAKKPEN